GARGEDHHLTISAHRVGDACAKTLNSILPNTHSRCISCHSVMHEDVRTVDICEAVPTDRIEVTRDQVVSPGGKGDKPAVSTDLCCLAPGIRLSAAAVQAYS